MCFQADYWIDILAWGRVVDKENFMKTHFAAILLAIAWISQAYAEAGQLNIATDRDAVLAVARQIIESDPFMTLVTVDEHGQPRTRTMEHSPPNDTMVIYLSTIPGTRKLAQIRANPNVTLYFDGPGDVTYLSIMGTATIHTDPETATKHAWRNEAARAKFWPSFPNNYVLIKVEPRWLEVVAPQVQSNDDDWRPQAVVFE
jgi:general stress protein 26